MRLGIGLHHAADYWCQLSLNGEEALEEGGCSLDASALVGRVGLQVVAIFRVQAQTVMVIISLNAHLLSQLDGILVAEVG